MHISDQKAPELAHVPTINDFANDHQKQVLRLVTSRQVVGRPFAAPPGVPDGDLDDLNRRLGAALLDDGRVFAGTTVHRGRVALRPAITNWRTTAREVDQLVDVVREIGAGLRA